MKKILLLALAITGTIFIAGAQPPPDTLWGGSPSAAYYNAILRATVVSGESEAITIVPTRGPFCFDKKIKIKSTVGGRVVEQCLYLNTTDGLTAFLKPVNSAPGSMCDIKPEDKEFWLSIIGLKGNVYNYHNTEGKDGENEVKHWVSTGNTQQHLYQTPAGTGVHTLRNKRERRSYCDDKIKGTAYKYDGAGMPTMYLFGKNYPDNINVTSNKYIGNFGIGYQYTDKGLYIIMEVISSSYTCRITSIEDVNVCFDPSPFRVMEDEFQTKRRAELVKEEEKINRREAAIRSGDECAGQRRAIIAFDREELRKQQAALGIMPTGNIYQDRNVQNAYNSMMDPLTMVRSGILTTKLSICNAEVNIRKHPTSNTAQERLACHTTQLGKLTAAEVQMMANVTRFADHPGKAKAENSRIYLDLMRTACN